MSTPKALTYAAAIEYCGLCKRRLEELVAQRLVDVYRDGRKVLIDRASLDAWLEARKVPAQELRPVHVAGRPRSRRED